MTDTPKMKNISKDDLAKAIDGLIEASGAVSEVVVTLKGVQTSIDEVSTQLFFHYKDDNK